MDKTKRDMETGYMTQSWAPQTSYTLWRNTASIMKSLVFGLFRLYLSQEYRQDQIFMVREVLKRFSPKIISILMQKSVFSEGSKNCVFKKVFTFRSKVSKLNFNKLVYFCKNMRILNLCSNV